MGWLVENTIAFYYLESSYERGDEHQFFTYIGGRTRRNQQTLQVQSSKNVLIKTNEALQQATQGCDEPFFTVFKNRLDKHMAGLYDLSSVQWIE